MIFTEGHATLINIDYPINPDTIPNPDNPNPILKFKVPERQAEILESATHFKNSHTLTSFELIAILNQLAKSIDFSKEIDTIGQLSHLILSTSSDNLAKVIDKPEFFNISNLAELDQYLPFFEDKSIFQVTKKYLLEHLNFEPKDKDEKYTGTFVGDIALNYLYRSDVSDKALANLPDDLKMSTLLIKLDQLSVPQVEKLLDKFQHGVSSVKVCNLICAHSSITDSQFNTLLQSLPKGTSIELDLSTCPNIRPNNIQIPKWITLSKLICAHSSITADQLSVLLQAIPKGTSMELDLSLCRNIGPGTIQALPEGVSIYKFKCTESSITGRQLNTFLQALQKGTDIELDISFCFKIGPDTFQALQEGVSIYKLNCRASTINASQLSVLYQATSKKKSIELDLSFFEEPEIFELKLPEWVVISKIICRGSSITSVQLTTFIENCIGSFELDIGACRNLGAEAIKVHERAILSKLTCKWSSITSLQFNTLLLSLPKGATIELGTISECEFLEPNTIVIPQYVRVELDPNDIYSQKVYELFSGLKLYCPQLRNSLN